MPPGDYLINGADMGAPGYCVFGIQGGLDSSMNMFIFGDVFLRSFYSIYDFDNFQVGLALHTTSQASIEEPSRKWLFVILAVSLIAVVVLIGIVCYLWKRKKVADEQRRQQEDI